MTAHQTPVQTGATDMTARMTACHRPDARPRKGLAFPAILFALVITGVLGALIFMMTDLHAKTVSNRERSLRAMHLAESGLNHALALVRDSTLRDTTLTRLLRGANLSTASDNGYLSGYTGLNSTNNIPKEGRAVTGGTYFVQLVDDPAEVDNDPLTDRNTRIRAICRGVTTDGSTATINAIIGNLSMPGFAVNGNVTISGTTRVTGRCGSVHTNGTLQVSATELVVQTGASSTGSTSGTIKNTYNEALPKQQNSDSVAFPAVLASDHCNSADYKISGTLVTNLLTGAVVTPLSLGWVGGPTIWEAKSNVAPGTYCVIGNVKMSDAVGTAASPRALSIIASGSMEISGESFLVPDTPNLMYLADGDIKLNGASTSTTPNFNGLIYAGSQCDLSGTVRIAGQLICGNKPNPAGAEQWASENKIGGTTHIAFGCGGFLGEFWRVIAWYPTIGS